VRERGGGFLTLSPKTFVLPPTLLSSIDNRYHLRASETSPTSSRLSLQVVAGLLPMASIRAAAKDLAVRIRILTTLKKCDLVI